MPGTGQTLTPQQARAILGLGPLSTAHEVRRAFREAAKRAHPDRPGGEAARFQQVLEAYHLLQGAGLALPAPATEDTLTITPVTALNGGERELMLTDGRRIRISLPPGLRQGDRLRTAGATFAIDITALGDTLVRGDDLWITARLAPQVLSDGGRVAVDTPLGRRIVWITKKAAERGLLRLAGEGLPARDGKSQGSLFIRLTAGETPVEGPARQQLRRFAAAWAA